MSPPPGVCAHCRRGCSGRSRQHWDVNPPAASPRGAQRSLLLITLQWLPLPWGERPKSSPWPGWASSRPRLCLPAAWRGGPSLLKSPPLRPVSGPLHLLVLPPLSLGFLLFQCPSWRGTSSSLCARASLLVDVPRLAHALSSLPTSFVINCEASASPTRRQTPGGRDDVCGVCGCVPSAVHGFSHPSF